jgi:anti-sigma B factor antagonist
MIPAFQVENTTRDGVPVVLLRGECDIAAEPALRAAIDAAFAEGATSLLFDLEEATFLDSSALGAFLSARRRATQAGGTVTLLCSAPPMLRLLTLLELHRIFDLRTRAEWDAMGDRVTG